MYLIPLGLFLEEGLGAGDALDADRIDSLGFHRIDVAGVLRPPSSR